MTADTDTTRVKEALDAITNERRRVDDATKEAVKEAIREWLDEKYASFGKWSLHGLLAMLLAGCVYLFMISQGWHK